MSFNHQVSQHTPIVGLELIAEGPQPVPLNQVKFVLMSVGVKSSLYTLPKADFYIDARGLLDSLFASEWPQQVISRPRVVEAMKEMVISAVEMIPARRMGKVAPEAIFDKPFSICFICAAGCNRSVTAKCLIGEWLKDQGAHVEIRQGSENRTHPIFERDRKRADAKWAALGEGS